MAQGHHPSQHASARGDCRYGGSGIKASPGGEAQHGPASGYANGTGFIPNNPLQLMRKSHSFFEHKFKLADLFVGNNQFWFYPC